MTENQKKAYEETDALREILKTLKGKKFKLDCGHHITFCHNLGNDITIYNSNTKPIIICSQCGY
jgi:hypothetical protein